MIKRLYDEKKIPLKMLKRLLKDYQNRFNGFVKKGIVPTLTDDRQRQLKIVKMSIIPNN
jgi:hypothetical protein